MAFLVSQASDASARMTCAQKYSRSFFFLLSGKLPSAGGAIFLRLGWIVVCTLRAELCLMCLFFSHGLCQPWCCTSTAPSLWQGAHCPSARAHGHPKRGETLCLC